MCAVSPMGFGIVCYEATCKNVIILLSYAISTIITAAIVEYVYVCQIDYSHFTCLIFLCTTYKTGIVNIPILLMRTLSS